MMKKGGMSMVGWVLISGCGREQVETYTVPKSAPVAEARLAEPKAVGFDSPLPEGWKQQPASGMRAASYTIRGTSIDFYAISLATGNLADNVNRWRRQIGLEPAAPKAIEDEAQPLVANGFPGHYIELFNSQTGRGILAAVIEKPPVYWYFTAKGSAEELKAHAEDIRRFVGSIRFR